jgi:hypothetical protein
MYGSRLLFHLKAIRVYTAASIHFFDPASGAHRRDFAPLSHAPYKKIMDSFNAINV